VFFFLLKRWFKNQGFGETFICPSCVKSSFEDIQDVLIDGVDLSKLVAAAGDDLHYARVSSLPFYDDQDDVDWELKTFLPISNKTGAYAPVLFRYLCCAFVFVFLLKKVCPLSCASKPSKHCKKEKESIQAFAASRFLGSTPTLLKSFHLKGSVAASRCLLNNSAKTSKIIKLGPQAPVLFQSFSWLFFREIPQEERRMEDDDWKPPPHVVQAEKKKKKNAMEAPPQQVMPQQVMNALPPPPVVVNVILAGVPPRELQQKPLQEEESSGLEVYYDLSGDDDVQWVKMTDDQVRAFKLGLTP
jgi:hypothetical protein